MELFRSHYEQCDAHVTPREFSDSISIPSTHNREGECTDVIIMIMRHFHKSYSPSSCLMCILLAKQGKIKYLANVEDEPDR